MPRVDLEKFPVVSEYGNEYYVSMWEDSCGFLSVYVYVQTKGWFGRTKYKNVWIDAVRASKYGYNFVEIAKKVVRNYEARCAKEVETRRLKREGIEAFHKWDGK